METTTRPRFSLELDVTTEDPTPDGRELHDLIGGLELTVELVTASGPGGGWPVYRFTGDKVAVYQLLIRYHEGDIGSVIDSFNDFAHEV